MPIRLEGSIKRYVGNSTDEKPELEQRDAGSSFLEEDTGLISRWNGRTWTLPPPGETELDVLREILATLKETREFLELVSG